MNSNHPTSFPDSGILFLIEALGSLRSLISAAASSDFDASLMQEAVNALIDHREFDGCVICLERTDHGSQENPGDPGPGGLAPTASAGLPQPLLDICADIAATVMRTGCAHHEPELFKRSDTLGGSLIVLPITNMPLGMGALAVWSHEPFRFQRWHEHLLELHCDVLSLALWRRDTLETPPVRLPARRVDPGMRIGPAEPDSTAHASTAAPKSL